MPSTELPVATLPNGVRLIVVPLPHRETAAVSVFVRSGSQDEPRALNGIGHVVEHMVFKGTATRDAARINLDAESLGAEVNAHTDKDHSAFHMHGLARDAASFVGQLADLVAAPAFPADEFERERQVLLQEFAEDEDDPMATAYRLFDHACYGLHPVGQPAIGRRATVERLSRADLQRWVERQFTGANVVVAVAGPVQPEAMLRATEAALGGLPPGQARAPDAPAWRGGVRARRLEGSSQAHVVMGLPVAPRTADSPLAELAAAVFGEGMSAPLMAELRERRGLVYYAACAADVLDSCGELVVEASLDPARLDELWHALPALLAGQADRVAPADLARARNQLAVKLLREQERPARRLEAAALDLLALGRVRPLEERLARLHEPGPSALSAAFAHWLSAPAAAALTGRLARGARDKAQGALDGLRAAAAAEFTAG